MKLKTILLSALVLFLLVELTVFFAGCKAVEDPKPPADTERMDSPRAGDVEPLPDILEAVKRAVGVCQR